MQLDEAIERLKKLKPSELQKVIGTTTAVRKALGVEKWIPTVGPQFQAYNSKADVTGFGGEPGGGKTELGLGLAFNQHKRSLLMRRQYTDLSGLVDAAIRINGSRDGYNGQPPPRLTIGPEHFIDFAGCNRVGDEQHWMGKAHDLICVGKGTPVLMGNGFLKPIEAIETGDVVMTLEGGKRVNNVLPVRHGYAAKVTAFSDDGKIIGSQIQSCAHSILTTSGWESHDTSYGFLPSVSSESTIFHDLCKFLSLSLERPFRVLQDHVSKVMGRLHIFGQSLLRFCLSGSMVSYASSEPVCQGNENVSYGGRNQDTSLRPLLSVLRGLLKPVLLSATNRVTATPFSSNVIFDDLAESLFQGLNGNYSSGIRPCGGRTRLLIHRGFESVIGQEYPRRSNDVAPSIPNDLRVDESVETPKHSHRISTYSHPYTKEKRPTDAVLSACSFSSVPVGEVDLYDIEVEDANHYISSNGFINKNCLDESTQFAWVQIRFLLGWLRHENPNQRTRAILPTNPPLSAEGVWYLDMFAPWLDDKYPYPAKPGELRWVVTDDSGKDVWVQGPDDMRSVEIAGQKRLIKPTSRTFIPSSLEDNPFYAAGSYRSKIDAMGEPHRSILLGKFKTTFKDQPNQVIPTAWIKEAQERWTPKPPAEVPMCAIGVDCSGGGADPMIIARRHDGWYAPLIEIPGDKIPMDRSGAYCGGLIVGYRRDDAMVVVDLGGGYGGPTYEHLKANSVEVTGFRGAEGTRRRSSEGKHKFTNKRSAALWLFREALDPGQSGGSPIALPDDPALVADLTAPTFEPVPNGIKVESKEDVCDRLGRSTDRGDAVVMAWFEGSRETTSALDWADQRDWKHGLHRRPQVLMSHKPLTARLH